MNLEYSSTEIVFNKELSALDEFVLEFTSILTKLGINYVLVSGYVPILFGRSRSSEDIDLFIEKLGILEFKKLWSVLMKKFDCINTEDIREAYNDFLIKNTAIRFSRKDEFIPNMEVKFPKIELDQWTIDNKKKVILNGNHLFISPLELQIPFKLYLGGEKDIEDARFLYNLFKDKIDHELLEEFVRKLKIEQKYKDYLI